MMVGVKPLMVFVFDHKLSLSLNYTTSKRDKEQTLNQFLQHCIIKKVSFKRKTMMTDTVCYMCVILSSSFKRLKQLNPPHCGIQGEAMRSLQILSHQRDPIPSIEVAHVDALHHGLYDIKFEVDPVHSKVLDIVDCSSQNLLNVTPVVVGRVYLTKEQKGLNEYIKKL